MPDQPPYKIKYRPNIFDLAIIDGYLYGGGSTYPATREAYWQEKHMPDEQEEERLEERILNNIISLPARKNIL
ncbi:MAG: hypothetical protein MRY79_08340 [Alphaproteobacteria bacterium]|nr:hypothetical protein [Alphaproteobacteria bacterium]